MIGALLIVFLLAVVFLTRPNNKRDRFLLELWRRTKKHLRKRPVKNRIPRPIKRASKVKITIDGQPYRPDFFAEQTSADQQARKIIGAEKITLQPITADYCTDICRNDPHLSSDGDPQQEIIPEKAAEIKISGPAADNHTLDPMPVLQTGHDQRMATLTAQNQTNIQKEDQTPEKFGADIKPSKPMHESPQDDSVIDIEQTYEPIRAENTDNIPEETVPEWPHTYIYSYADLDRATTKQTKFYYKLKEKFLQGGWIDIGDNSNYAFVLLFNLLRDFNTHQDIKLLEEQFDRLGGHFPKTASYANRFLIQKMRDIGDTEGLERLEWTIINNRTDYQSWDWRQRYIKRLGLSKAEGKLLDDCYPRSNSFMWIDTCATEVIKLYIELRKALQAAYKKNKIEQSVQFDQLLDILARKQYNYRNGSQNYQYTMKHGTSTLWEYLFKYCEVRIKHHYACSKSIDFLTGYHQELVDCFHQLILSHVAQKADELIEHLEKPSAELEIELNTTITTRWKTSFDLSEEYYDQHGRESFQARAREILRLNVGNPSLELIHLEISKSAMRSDKQLAFEHFIRYTGENLQRRRLVLKSMSQKMVKTLFTTTQQQTEYYQLMTALVRKDITVEQALEQIKGYYLPKRKKIVLDNKAIKSVEVQYSGTVVLLSEYLKEEEAPQDITEAETVEHSIQPTTSDQHFGFNASPTEAALIALFQVHNFALDRDQMAEFCKAYGTMAGPLVNNLNETCYELLDDLLIEQNEDEYTLNPNYYDQITTI
ncbi:tellurite resistance TerB C-terminal domain-containing protein [uncultured Pedobacter sp.]|uniref:tellurite resistance TerB C-terminal domain-containing protein n=1 Tax=uncultured Pedobacter sp. TaxID=246139 RepID=UPI00261BA958|nr:tellurite resistance TerB C-terminal domain-containing protein [uncultured Pedobacter sp.]